MNRLRAAILAAMLALVATPAPAAQDSGRDLLRFLEECAKLGRSYECLNEMTRRRIEQETGRQRVPTPTPRPAPAPTPREWRI